MVKIEILKDKVIIVRNKLKEKNEYNAFIHDKKDLSHIKIMIRYPPLNDKKFLEFNTEHEKIRHLITFSDNARIVDYDYNEEEKSLTLIFYLD